MRVWLMTFPREQQIYATRDKDIAAQVKREIKELALDGFVQELELQTEHEAVSKIIGNVLETCKTNAIKKLSKAERFALEL